jgi:hypothetical protein
METLIYTAAYLLYMWLWTNHLYKTRIPIFFAFVALIATGVYMYKMTIFVIDLM